VKNDKNTGIKEEKKISKIKKSLAFWKAKLQVDENGPQYSKPKLKSKSNLKPKSKPKSIKTKTDVKDQARTEKKKHVMIKKKPAVKIKPKPKITIKPASKDQAKVEKKKQAKIKVEAKKKAKVEKKKQAKIKVEAKKKAKVEKKKQAKIKEEAKKKAKAEAKRKEEEDKEKEAEAKRKEEEAQRTYEETLEEQLSEEEITGFQLEKTDMDKMCNKVCEIIAGYESKGTLQSELWKKLKLSSRDGSRLALKLERMGMITREKILEKERWTYKLIIKKIPISTKSIEGSPCLTCPVEAKCSIDGEISPKTCNLIEDWVKIELKNK